MKQRTFWACGHWTPGAQHVLPAGAFPSHYTCPECGLENVRERQEAREILEAVNAEKIVAKLRHVEQLVVRICKAELIHRSGDLSNSVYYRLADGRELRISDHPCPRVDWKGPEIIVY